MNASSFEFLIYGRMIVRIFCILLLLPILLVAEEAPADYSMAATDSTYADSLSEEKEFTDYLKHPLTYIVQPVLDILVYPLAAPIRYASKHDVIEKSAEALAFGENKNIFLYPTFNIKPGTKTMLGLEYRHRNMILEKDYFVANASLFVNSDLKFSVRYTKRNLFGSDFFAGGRLDWQMDRDAAYSIPRSLTLHDNDEPFVYTDSTYSAQFRVGHSLPYVRNMDVQAQVGVERNLYDYPDVKDTILRCHPIFDPNARGFYQNHYEIPLSLTLTYDNTDAPFVPTKGSRISTTWTYVNVTDYTGAHVRPGANDWNHDYQKFDFVAQHYFYLGKDNSQYGLSVKEAREFRKFYTDFSWEETLRLWRPENIQQTLLNRRVLAVQFRLRQMWEMEEGGAPFNAFLNAGGTFPLRGYTRRYTDYALKGISVEYRWPIDRLVDGVLFDEYVMYGRHWYGMDGEKLLNSWGFGIRVRKPDLYFFRIQIGFHGLHGFAAICTIAPEFQ